MEVDETFIGGRARFMHKSKRDEIPQGTAHVGVGKRLTYSDLTGKTV